MAPHVMTVAGPIPPDRLGFTLPHEHTSCSVEQLPAREQAYDFTPDLDLVVDELRDARRRGAATIVDVTSDGLGRDPLWLRAIASRTGLNVVMGGGWYRGSFFPPAARIDRRTVDQLADAIVAEFEGGVGDTGVRPGIIGEVGTDAAWISPAEERVHRAAARAAGGTGMAVTTHSLHGRVALEQLRLFSDEGLDPGRVVIGHADANPDLDYYLAILDRGASLQFDQLGASPESVGGAREPRLVELIVELLERGFASQLFLSQDVCHDRQLKASGGFGYTYLQQHFLPKLRTAAVGEGEIAEMTIDNPRRLLTLP